MSICLKNGQKGERRCPKTWCASWTIKHFWWEEVWENKEFLWKPSKRYNIYDRSYSSVDSGKLDLEKDKQRFIKAV